MGNIWHWNEQETLINHNPKEARETLGKCSYKTTSYGIRAEGFSPLLHGSQSNVFFGGKISRKIGWQIIILMF